MTQRRFGIPGFFVLLLVALPASSGRAEAAESTDPFADLDAINITVGVGGPLDLEGGTAPQLFTDEVGRFGRFRRALSRSVGAKLESCGILWDQGARNDMVSIFVFGRREDLQQGPPQYVYMVQVEVLNTALASHQAKPEPVALRPVIGIADEAGVEQALIDTAVAVVAGELRNCSP